jgi:hypothetical protein
MPQNNPGGFGGYGPNQWDVQYTGNQGNNFGAPNYNNPGNNFNAPNYNNPGSNFGAPNSPNPTTPTTPQTFSSQVLSGSPIAQNATFTSCSGTATI